MQSKRVSPTAIALVAGLLLLTLFAGAWFGLLAPKRAEAANLDRQIEATRVLLAAPPAKPAATKKKQEVDWSAQLTRLSLAIPDQPQMPQIMDDLDALARQVKIRLDGIAPQAPVQQNGYQAVPVDVTLHGHFLDLSEFLRLLRAEASLKDGRPAGTGRLYSVDSLSFTQGEPTFPNVKATVRITAIYGAAAAAPVAGDAGPTDSPSSSTAAPAGS